MKMIKFWIMSGFCVIVGAILELVNLYGFVNDFSMTFFVLGWMIIWVPLAYWKDIKECEVVFESKKKKV